jgi:phage FluMu protein Com
MRSSNGDLTHRQDWVQDGTLLNVFGDVVGVFHCKSKNGVSTNVLSKSNHTHGGGGYNRIKCTGIFKDEVRVYLRKSQLCARICFGKHFLNKFSSVTEHTTWIHTGSKF